MPLTLGDRGVSQTFVNLKNRLVRRKEPPVIQDPALNPQFSVESLELVLKKKKLQTSIGYIKLDAYVGSGAFGKVFSGHLKRHDGSVNRVAIKFQKPLFGPLDPAIPMPKNYAEIEHEYKIMDRMSTYDGFVRVFAPNFAGRYKYYVMDYIGPDVDTLRGKREKFRLKTIMGLEIARQMLNRIRAVHAEGWVVHDIHPGNFLIDEQNKVYMIDLAFAYPYRDRDGTHISPNRAPFVFSNMRMLALASRREEKGELSSRIDDIERFLYMLILILKGSLPWEAVKNVQDARRMKLTMTPEELCDAVHLKWLTPVFSYVFQHSFDADPPYRYIDETLQMMLAHTKKVEREQKTNKKT